MDESSGGLARIFVRGRRAIPIERELARDVSAARVRGILRGYGIDSSALDDGQLLAALDDLSELLLLHTDESIIVATAVRL